MPHLFHPYIFTTTLQKGEGEMNKEQSIDYGLKVNILKVDNMNMVLLEDLK